MRRALSIVVFVGVLAWALFVLFHRERPDPLPTPAPAASSRPAPPADQPPPPPTPRPALPPEPDASAPLPHAAAAKDEQLLRGIRESVRSDPQRAERLAREARQRFPASKNADERDALLVDALINQQRIGAARSETYYYFDHHPDGRFAAHLFSMTGVHPTPHGPGHH